MAIPKVGDKIRIPMWNELWRGRCDRNGLTAVTAVHVIESGPDWPYETHVSVETGAAPGIEWNWKILEPNQAGGSYVVLKG